MTREFRKNIITLALIVVLAVLAGWVASPYHPSLHLGKFSRDLNVKLGLDLQGGTHLVYRANVSSVGEGEVEEALAGVRDVIERRVNAFGVAEPIVQTNRVGDEYRVIVELAGIYDPKEAISQIGETPQLVFHREVSEEEALKQFNIDDPKALTGTVFERTSLTGKNLKRATVSFDQISNAPQVNLEFDGEGTKMFADLTRENLGKRIAIYLDGVNISAPVVQAEITNGQAVISGGFMLEEARTLSQRLTAGALPVPVELIGQQTIGPSLGRLSIEQSIVAGVLGILAVMVWMTTYYRLPGLISAIALVFYAVFFLALVKLFPITLTLPGVAGFIISIGMAVDANVLIFERLRENLRHGKTMRYALEDGFAEAWDSIWASNIASLLTAIILYGMGTSIIRGFALTLALGIVLSMFTAVTLTRALLAVILIRKFAQRTWLLGVASTILKS